MNGNSGIVASVDGGSGAGAGARRVTALCYLVDRDHPQYAGALSTDEQVKLVRQGQGMSGNNRDYVLNTVDHLKTMKLTDTGLFAVAEAIGPRSVNR